MNETIKENASEIEESEMLAEATVHTEEPSGEAESTEEITEVDSKAEDNNPKTDYAALEAEDVSTIRELFPEYREISSITELDNPLRYAALRDLGLSVKEAFLATQRRQARYDNRSHLKSSVPRGARSDGISMSADALKEARELFSGLSDSEIQRLYKTVIK